MSNGGDRADLFTTSAEHWSTVIGVFYHRLLFAILFLEFINSECTIIYAFSTVYAFCIVNYRIPRYLVARDSFIRILNLRSFIFSHAVHLW